MRTEEIARPIKSVAAWDSQLFALAYDGTLWRYDSMERKWESVPSLPTKTITIEAVPVG